MMARRGTGFREAVRRTAKVGVRRGAQGWDRARDAALPIAEAALAAVAAWEFAVHVLGHPAPFFAPVASWVCLGFSRVRDVRLVAELAVGVSLGVAFGDLAVQFFGHGPVQMGLILAVSALVARFVDRGRLLTMQAGVQSLIVVAFPVAAGFSPLGRWTDALTGGIVSLAVAVLVPHSVLQPLRSASERGWREIAGVLDAVARGLKARSTRIADDALIRGRASSPVFVDWASAAQAAGRLVRLSPRRRRLRPDVDELIRESTYGDRAIRNARVIARRADMMLRDIPDSPEAVSRLQSLAEATASLAAVARRLAVAVGQGRAASAERSSVHDAGAHLTADLAGASWQPRVYVLLLRSLTIDLLQACGLTNLQARAALPPIEDLKEA
jgi:uncharacterized membrane protein YgaE (UPF0421/DUF939 family)